MYNIICVKFGNKYSSDFVNKLFKDCSLVHRSFEFYCYTDDPEGIDSQINIVNPIGPTLKGVWNKLALFSNEFPVKGKNIFLDLDVSVQNNIIERLESYEHDWDTLHLVHAPWKNNKKRYGRLSSYDVIHHSSVMVWENSDQWVNNVQKIWKHFNSGLRDYFMRKYKGIDRFLAHEDFHVEYLPTHFTLSKKHEKFDPLKRMKPAVITYEEIDVRLEDLV